MGRGVWEERVPAPFIWTKPFSTELFAAFPLLQHGTYCSKLSLKFNTQRVPWNLDKSTGKQLTSFWLERWWEGAQGGGKPGNSGLGPRRLEATSLTCSTWLENGITSPGDLETLLPACLPTPAARAAFGLLSPFQKVAFSPSGNKEELEAERWVGLSWPQSSGDLPAFHRPSPATENMEPPVGRSWSWWEESGARSWPRRWHCVTALPPEHSGASSRFRSVSTETCLARGDRRHRPTHGRWGLERWPPASAINKHPCLPGSLGKDKIRDGFLSETVWIVELWDGCLLYFLTSVYLTSQVQFS